ncbi:MAG TPA: autotransporter domain-containing protein [Rhodanobacter sp.]
MDGDQSTATGAITVASGATLGGKGILGGNVTVADGATLAPGSNGAIGTLAIHGDLGLSAGTMLDYTFGQANTAGGQFNDLINVDGNLVLDGILNVGVAPGGSFGPGVYRVFNYTGTLADNGLALGTIPSSASLVQTGVTHQVNLINTEGMVFSFWDGNAGPKRNNVINGGSGIWESGNSRTLNNWTDASGAVNAPFADRTFAVFQATPGTVTVDDGNGVVNAAGMQFASDGYVVWGDTIHLVGSAEDPAHSTIRVGDGTNASSGYRTTIHSMLDGDTTLVKADAGTLVLTGANTYTGGTTINGGALQIGNGGTTGSITGNVIDNGALVFNRSDSVTFNGSVSGSGSLEQAGTGSLILTSANAYIGGTTISSGTLRIGNGGTTGSIIGDVINNGSLVFNQSDDLTFNGIISGSGSLAQAGTGSLILTGANTYTGDTTIGGGTLQIGNGGTTGSIHSDVTNNGYLVFDRSDTVIFNGIVSGTGSLEQAGTGKLILTGASTTTNINLVSSGTMEIAASGALGTGDVDVDNTDGQNATLKVDSGASIGNRVFLKNAATLDNSGTITGSLGNVVEGTYIAGSNAQVTVSNRVGGVIEGLGNQTVAMMMGCNASITNQGYIGGNATAIILVGGGAVDNDGGTIEALPTFYNSTIATFYGATVTNRGGGKIISSGSGALDALHMNGGGNVYNDGQGSSIRADLTAIYMETAPGFVKNSNGASIVGQLGGVYLSYSGEVDNDGKDSVIGATLPSSVTVYIGGGGSSTVRNNEGATIYNEGADGRAVMAPANVFNDKSTISATGVGSLGIELLGTGLEVVNSNGASVTGQRVGIFLYHGGTVTNSSGSTISTTSAVAGNCFATGSCALFVPVYSDDPSNGAGGALTFRNAGSIFGNVQMDTASPNNTELTAGGFIQGDLSIGTNTQSTLTLDGDSATSQLYSHAVTGTTTFNGSLIKDGGGTWILDSSDLFSVSDTEVNDGVLQATNMLAGPVSVVATGTLDGVPGIVGNLTNAGKVAVHGGDSTVGGNYVQSSTGTLAVSLGSKLDVAGAATLSGGTLEVTGADSGYVSNTHTDILAASGGVNGTFDQLVKGTGVVFTATTINYDANSVWLDTTGLNVTTAAAGNGVSYTAASMGSALRVQAAFEQLNGKIGTGDLAGVSGNFLQAAGQFQQSPTLLAAQASLQSLSGQLHADSAAMTFRAIDASSRALSDRFDNLLDKGTGFGMWTHNLSVGGDMARVGFDSVGFQLNGWLVGSDRRIGQSGVAGFAFGQSQGQQRLDQGYDHDNSRSTEGMLYAGWLNGNWYTQGRIGFGHSRQDVSRQILLGNSAQGVQTQYNGSYDVAYGESGLHFGHGNNHVAPFVNVEYARIDRGDFAEQGAGGFGLRSNAQTLDRWQAGLGVRAGHHWVLKGGGTVDFSARAQWQRTLASHGDVFDASFVGLQQWRPLVGIGLSRYSGLLGIGLDATLSTQTTLKFGYDYEMGQSDHAQMLSARLHMAF